MRIQAIGGRKIEGVIFDLDGVITQLDLSTLDMASSRLQWLDPLLSASDRQMVFRRILIMLEGLVNFFVSQLWRLKLQRDLNRLQPIIDRFRCFPPVEHYELHPGVLAFLQSLRPNYQLALVTVRRRDEIAHFLEQNGLDESLFFGNRHRDRVTNSLPQNPIS